MIILLLLPHVDLSFMEIKWPNQMTLFSLEPESATQEWNSALRFEASAALGSTTLGFDDEIESGFLKHCATTRYQKKDPDIYKINHVSLYIQEINLKDSGSP